MCIKSEEHLDKSKDVHKKRGISSLKARMCIKSEEHIFIKSKDVQKKSTNIFIKKERMWKRSRDHLRKK